MIVCIVYALLLFLLELEELRDVHAEPCAHHHLVVCSLLQLPLLDVLCTLLLLHLIPLFIRQVVFFVLFLDTHNLRTLAQLIGQLRKPFKRRDHLLGVALSVITLSRYLLFPAVRLFLFLFHEFLF